MKMNHHFRCYVVNYKHIHPRAVASIVILLNSNLLLYYDEYVQILSNYNNRFSHCVDEVSS